MDQKKTTGKKQSGVINDLLHLVYPQTCINCSRELAASDRHICSFCNDNLTFTDFHLFREPSPMDKLFWGRVPVKSTYAHIHFKKNAVAQKILFNLKYGNDKELGLYFGKEIGKLIRTHPNFNGVDLIIPVPLHYKKLFIRGYNQSSVLAKGVSETAAIPFNDSLVSRKKHTSTQTKKNRFQRWENVESVFAVKAGIRKYRHIVLVDDVITTGSTIEALIRSVREKHQDIAISVVTLAIA